MKIFTMCMECQKQFGIPSFEPIIADYYEGAIAYIECANGHKSALLLQSQKFEVLLESAANALLEGYTIEAASTFSAAYERFFEFAIKVFCESHKIEEAPFNNTFKQVSKQSERQIGAFLFLHLVTLGKEYKLNEKIPPFRNKVIHQGYIPTPQEAIDFGELIYQEIYSITQLLKSSFPEELRKTVFSDIDARNREIPEATPRATSTGAMFFCLSMAEQKPNLQEALAAYKEAREKISGAMPYMKALSKVVSLYASVKSKL
jgi:hypothetical protein